MLQDPTNGFSIIPSSNKEFESLIGLEDVVRFRLEWLDKTVNTSPNQHKTNGRQKKIPTPTGSVPATLCKDPYTCATCNTDVSSSWKRNGDSSVQCQSCFQSSWRKDHWPSSKPADTIIESVFGNSTSFTSSNQPLQHSSQLVHQHCDQQVPKNSLALSSKVHPDSPCHCSSPLTSDVSSSPPEFYSDPSSQCSSSIPSDHYYSGSFISLSSFGSSLCDDSSPMYLQFSSELYASSSSVSPQRQCILQKVKTPNQVESPLAKHLPEDSKVKQETKKEKAVQQTRNRTQCKTLETRKMATKSVEDELKPGHGNLQKVTLDASVVHVSSVTPGTCTFSSGSVMPRATIPQHGRLPTETQISKTHVHFQDQSTVRKKESDTQNEPFGTKMQHQANQTRPSSSPISLASNHTSVLSQTAFSTSMGKVTWEAAPSQRIDGCLQKPKTSLGSQGSCSFCASSSFDQPYQVL